MDPLGIWRSINAACKFGIMEKYSSETIYVTTVTTVKKQATPIEKNPRIASADKAGFSYDRIEDRLSVLGFYSSQQGSDSPDVIQAVFTRACLIKFLHTFNNWLSGRDSSDGVKQSTAKQAGGADDNQAIHKSAGKIVPPREYTAQVFHREQDIAAKHLNTTTATIKKSEINGTPFLVHKSNARRTGQGLILELTNDDASQSLTFRMSELELHRFLSQLTGVAESADWSLPDSVQPDSAEPKPATQLSTH